MRLLKLKSKVQLDVEYNCCLAIEWQLYMAVNFGDEVKVLLAANFFK